MSETNPFRVLSPGSEDLLERSSLAQQTTNLLRSRIVKGIIPPGTQLVEREIAESLRVSRAPVREALRELEQEGLVASTSSGRQVIELTEDDVRGLYDVRISLEKLAAERAAENITPEGSRHLTAELNAMQMAIDQHNDRDYVAADMETHLLIWQESRNPHLLGVLRSISGPIWMFIMNNAQFFDWGTVFEDHEEVVRLIMAGDGQAAAEIMEAQLREGMRKSLQVFRDRG